MISNGWMNVNRVQLHLSGLIETASYTVMLKIWITGWQFEVRLLLFAVVPAPKHFDHASFEVLEAITP